MKRLAKVSGSKVLSYDRPAFGLTTRVDNQAKKPLNPYSMAFAVLATLYFFDFLAADKAILVGYAQLPHLRIFGSPLTILYYV